MAFKLAVADMIGITVEGATRDDHGKDKPFKFVLVCDRLDADQIRAQLNDKEGTTTGFFEEHAKDWRGQNLVLGDDDKPAPFSVEALRVLFTIGGLSAMCWQAYLTQVVASAKN
jgi:hypothetical protein